MLGDKLFALPKLCHLGVFSCGIVVNPNIMAPLAETVRNHPQLLKLVVSYNCDGETFEQWRVACARRGMVEDSDGDPPRIASRLQKMGKRGQKLMKFYYGGFNQKLVFIHLSIASPVPRRHRMSDKYHFLVGRWSDS